jgi:hypothetical protein
MNFKLNPGGIILGLVGCFGLGFYDTMVLKSDVPKFFFIGGLVGGALLGNLLWSTWRKAKIARCAHEWMPHPKRGEDMVRCTRCHAEGRQARTG